MKTNPLNLNIQPGTACKNQPNIESQSDVIKTSVLKTIKDKLLIRKQMCASTLVFLSDLQLTLKSSGGTSVGNHNRSSVGIGCCCQCDFLIIIGS